MDVKKLENEMNREIAHEREEAFKKALRQQAEAIESAEKRLEEAKDNLTTQKNKYADMMKNPNNYINTKGTGPYSYSGSGTVTFTCTNSKVSF